MLYREDFTTGLIKKNSKSVEEAGAVA